MFDPTNRCAEHYGLRRVCLPVLAAAIALSQRLQVNPSLIGLNVRQWGCRGFRHLHRHGSVSLSPRLLALP